MQIQTHPNVDKELSRPKQSIAMKNATKPFPINTDVGILKWRFQTQDEAFIPLNVTCWPNENASGGCDVNIDYELQDDRLELNDVVVAIPLPSVSPSCLNVHNLVFRIRIQIEHFLSI